MTSLRRFLLLGALALTQLGCGGGAPCAGSGESASCTRVLFVGNSYTFVNDLPGMFTALAASGGRHVQAGMAAVGGARLADHVSSSGTAAALASARWSVVVLQEQSQIPADAALRERQMVPAATELVRRVHAAGAAPLFFVTWAHRDGWPEDGLADYAAMQAAVDNGYLAVAREQHAGVAPVGYAWWTVVSQNPAAGLWQDDGSHPTVAGTYLAACVFYATVFGRNPKGLDYRADLPAEEAATLQEVAAKIVLTDPASWGLPAAKP